MKRIYTYIISVAGLLLSSCQELTIDSQPDAPTAIYIDALDEYDVLAISPSRIVFNVSSNTPWQIETDSQWCIPTPSMSASSSLVSEIVIIPEDNPDTTARMATLTITAEDLGTVREVTVLQAARPKEPAVTEEPETPDGPEAPAHALNVTFSETASYLVNHSTGSVKVNFTQGEMLRTNFLTQQGRFAIEFEEIKMSAICNLGFVFLGSTTDANYKFHIEGSNTYWFRCAGAFGWIAPIKKAYTFDQVNAIRKLEFVVKDSPSGAGLLDISIYINGELYGTQAGRKDVFTNGEEGCVFILEAGVQPAEGDYCIIKSITYSNE